MRSSNFIVHSALICLILLFIGCTIDTTNQTKYPSAAKQLKFMRNGTDSLKIVKEIDFFSKGTSGFFGKVTSIELLDSNVYIGDRKQNKIFVFNKDDLNYRYSFGDSNDKAVNGVPGLFGPLVFGNELLVGSLGASFLFKKFTRSGDVLSVYKTTYSFYWGIQPSANNAFISDSLAYLVKPSVDNMFRVRPLKFKSGHLIKENEDILPITDFHSAIGLDSVRAVNVVPSIHLLKSSLKKQFYAIPSNKYLVNIYSMEGKLINSIDLRGIPEIALADAQFEEIKLFNTYFSSVAIDGKDNIFIPIQKISNTELVKQKRLNEIHADFFLIAINLEKLTYKCFKINAVDFSPLKVIEEKLWGYDARLSRVIIYQLPKS